MNDNGFIVSIFTPSLIQDDEVEKLSILLSSGIDYVHLRHPHADIDAIRSLLSSIPDKYYKSIILHDFFCLADEFSDIGVQINSRNSIAPISVSKITKSCHAVDEIATSEGLLYATLSPIYPSISKPGYDKRPNLAGLDTLDIPVLALGGVTPDKFDEIRMLGFSGAALLGYLWEDYKSFDKKIDIILKRKYICCNL
jgi:thiamine-phosphate pyrophosphorylase